MILTSEQTYQVRPRRLFKVLSDFDGLEELIRQYGAEITHRTQGCEDGTGRGWHLKVGYKGVTRRIVAKVAEVTPLTGYVVTAKADDIHVDVQVHLSSSGDKETKAVVTAAMSGRGLAARVLLQSMRLAHGSLEAKFHSRVVASTRSRLATARKT